MGKETGLGWNSETGTIVADPTWWDAKIKENAKYAKFRYQGLEFRDDLDFIYGETVATTQCQWTPALGVPLEFDGKNTIDEMKSVFPHPPEGKYYLVDAGYPNMKGYLSPYKDRTVELNPCIHSIHD
ncbi:hypothetical protein P8452_36579 [Trifolium repens]|nr:hypothetical protein P8452_36579 [Trifolium repens]